MKYENKGDRSKTISVVEYLNKTRPYLKDIISKLKKTGTKKVQLSIAINFFSSKDNDEGRAMDSKCDNIEIMINDKAHEVIEELYVSLLNRYQVGLQTTIRSSDFIFDCVHKINVIK